MAKKTAKKKAPAKKVAKKAVKKAVAKKVAKKAVKKAPAKKVAKKAVKKAPAKKVAKKAVKKAPAKKVAKKAVKKAPAKKVVKKAVKKATAKKTTKKVSADGQSRSEAPTRKNLVKKVARRARVIKKVEKEEDLAPIVVKRPYTRPEKLAKLSSFEKRQQKKLLELRDQITDSMYGIQNDSIKNANEGSDTSGSGMHQGDAGSDAYDRDFALTMLSKEANALGEIEEALQRLELGTYGICEESGKKIPQPRLEAMPFARLTVECQAAKERRDSLSDHTNRDFGFN
jgi:RNA polymerase-binding transcription factor DksA